MGSRLSTEHGRLLYRCRSSVVAQPVSASEVGAISQHLLDSILGSDALHLIPRNKRPVAPD